MIHKNRDAAFKEMIRVLKPGGKFAIMEPPRGYKWGINEDLKRKLGNFGLKNVKFISMMIRYPKKRNVYIICGEKEGKNEVQGSRYLRNFTSPKTLYAITPIIK